MTSPNDSTSNAATLDFSRAEYDSSLRRGAACGFCNQGIADQYWQIGDRVACENCRAGAARAIEHGQSAPAFWGGLRLGALAAVAGSVCWVIVTKITGYELAIVAIGIGVLVGKSVRKGAGGLGHRRLQILAICLTYAAISLASVPTIFEAIRSAPHSGPPHAPSLGGFLLAWCFVIGLGLASPFLGGISNFMGIVIIGIGLYEAWKYTAPSPIQIVGPFQLEASEPKAEPSAHEPA